MVKDSDFRNAQPDDRLVPVFTSSQLNAYLEELEKKQERQEECDKS